MTNNETKPINHPSPQTTEDKLIELLSPIVAPLGYEIVHVEVQLHRQKLLRLFIDHLSIANSHTESTAGVGIEDCVKVSRALDEPLDLVPEIEHVFQGPYELEVSSPGVDRPLRTLKDYERFSGRDVRIHVFRPLTGEELGNSAYQVKNPKQKNFIGRLLGVKGNAVVLAVGEQLNISKKMSRKKTKPGIPALAQEQGEKVAIPLPLISKANLEPKFEEFDERE